ncbi:MAG: coproporphyrinogen III oxidase [Flavobacteriaceae bacterium]
MKNKFNRYIEKLQDRITQKLTEVDGKACFKEDFWERSDGGGGRTRTR